MAWTAHRPARVRQKICAADFPPCWHGCRGPLVWTNSLFRQALDCKSSRLIVSTCCRFCRFRWLCRFQANAAEADTAAESADTVPRAATAPVPEPALFHQRVPSTTFPAWPGQSGVQPVFVEKSALPIFPDGPPAAQICAADLSRRWHGCHRPDIQTSSPLRQALDCPVPRSRERCRIASQPPRRRAPGGARGGRIGATWG